MEYDDECASFYKSKVLLSIFSSARHELNIREVDLNSNY